MIQKTSFAPLLLSGLALVCAAGCGAPAEIADPPADLKPSPELTFSRLKGTVDGFDEDGTYIHMITRVPAGKDADLEGYIDEPAGRSWEIDATLAPETLVYDYERVYMVLKGDGCELYLDAWYEGDDLGGSMTDQFALGGTMFIQYGLMSESYAVGGGEDEVYWFIEFPEGSIAPLE